MPKKAIPKYVKTAIEADIKTGKNIKEIAARHGVAESTVRRYHKAQKQLNEQATTAVEKIVAAEPSRPPFTENLADDNRLLRAEIDRMRDEIADLHTALRTLVGVIRV